MDGMTQRRDGATSAERRAEIAAPLTPAQYKGIRERVGTSVDDALVEFGNAQFDCGDWRDGDEWESKSYDALADETRLQRDRLLIAIDARITAAEGERDLLAETARRLTAERDAAVAERDEMLAAVVVAHSDLIRYGTHDDNCPKTPGLVQGVVVYGEALEPRACECGLDGGIMAAQDAFSAPDAAARAAARPEGRAGE